MNFDVEKYYDPVETLKENVDLIISKVENLVEYIRDDHENIPFTDFKFGRIAGHVDVIIDTLLKLKKELE